MFQGRLRTMLLTSCFLLNATAYSFQIYNDSVDIDALGYGNCDACTNGERKVIQHFIKEGDVVIDVGAHVGDWSQLVLDHTNRDCTLYAFEPVPAFFAQFKNRIRGRAKCYNYALGNKETTAVMNYCKKNGDWSSLFDRPVFSEVPVEKITIQVTTLDSFCGHHSVKHINFLKIDTEGYEWEVLKGVRTMLQEKKIDYIQFEYGGTYPDAGITLKQVYHYLRSYGYRIFRIVPTGLIHIPVWRDALETGEYSNYIAQLDA